jgi:hypothetical protein
MDNVQKNAITDYNAPSSEPFILQPSSYSSQCEPEISQNHRILQKLEICGTIIISKGHLRYLFTDSFIQIWCTYDKHFSGSYRFDS